MDMKILFCLIFLCLVLLEVDASCQCTCKSKEKKTNKAVTVLRKGVCAVGKGARKGAQVACRGLVKVKDAGSALRREVKTNGFKQTMKNGVYAGGRMAKKAGKTAVCKVRSFFKSK